MRVAKRGLLQASTMLFSITLLTNVCNYGFHAMASRMLGPVDYGALVSMLALMTIMAIPSQAIQMVVAKRVATEEEQGRHDRIAALTRQMLLRVTWLGLGLWAILAILSPWGTTFLKLTGPGPILAVGAVTLVWLALPVVRGLLQGFQYFGHLGLNLFTDAVLRLGLGAIFFSVGWRVTSGLNAGVISGGLAFLLAFIPLRALGKEPAVPTRDLDFGSLYRYAVPVVLTLGAYMVLASLDVILVKHYFEPEQAGYYSAASIVGKAFLFLPLAVAQVLFPKVSAAQARSEDVLHLLQKSLGLTAGILVLGILGAWALGHLIVVTLFGPAFLNPETLHLVQCFGMAVTPLALVYILLQYNLAIVNQRFMLLLLLDIPVLLGVLMFFHQTLGQVLLGMGLNAHLVVFIAGYFITIRKA